MEPLEATRVPAFGLEGPLPCLFLNMVGQQRLFRVLTCLRWEHSEASYCPFLPLAVAACLHWMPEERAFAVASALLRDPVPCPETRLETWLMLAAATDLAVSEEPRALRRLCAQQGVAYPPPLAHHHPLAGTVLRWVMALPYWCLVRFLDNWLVEGEKTFYRFALAILRCWLATVAPEKHKARRKSMEFEVAIHCPDSAAKVRQASTVAHCR